MPPVLRLLKMMGVLPFFWHGCKPCKPTSYSLCPLFPYYATRRKAPGMLSCTPFVGRSRADSSPCHKNSKCPRAPLQTLSSCHDPHAKKEIIPIFPSLLAVLTVDRPHFEPGSGTSPLFALESCNYGFPFPSLPQLPSNSSQMPLTETTDGECDLPC